MLFYHYIQLISLITAAVCYRGLRQFSILAFVPLLVIICTVEITAIWYQPNYFVYNLYFILSAPFFFYLFGNMLKANHKIKRLYKTICSVIFLFIMTNYLLIEGFNQVNIYTIVLMQLFTVILTSIILFQMAVNEKIEGSFLKEPYFWITAALLLFALGALITFGLQRYIRTNNIEINGRAIYRVIMRPLNIFLYSCYTIAFILCQLQTRKKS